MLRMTTSLLSRMRNPVCALVLAAVPAPALAELSASDVWEAFSKQLSPYGQMQADLAQAGNTLTARAITLSTEVEGMRSETALSGAISFRENTDGTVSILFPAQMTATLNVTGAPGGTSDVSTSASYAFSQQGMKVTASGEPGRIMHDFSAPEMSYELQGMTVNPSSASPRPKSRATLEAQSTSTIPQDMQSMTPQAIFASGFGMAGQMAYGPVSYTANVTSKGQDIQVQGRIAQGDASVSMDGDQVRYAVTSEQMSVAGGMSGLPLPPVEVELERSSFDLLMPLAQTDVARDFGLGLALEGFTVNIFDTAALESASTSPGKIESLSLEALEVSIAGASLTGDGAFTFDNTDLATFGGVPRPQGSVDLALTGGITLLDTLTAMNVVPQQQAFGIKALTGLFAKPGPGPDALTSRIEIDATGRILANGQQIR